MEKLKLESLVAADLRVSNADIETREYNISAVIRVENSTVNNVTQGQVAKVDTSDNTGAYLATFDSWNSESLNVQFQTNDNRDTILANIGDFISKCRTDEGLTTLSVTE